MGGSGWKARSEIRFGTSLGTSLLHVQVEKENRQLDI